LRRLSLVLADSNASRICCLLMNLVDK
jgi:hypothetical protein